MPSLDDLLTARARLMAARSEAMERAAAAKLEIQRLDAEILKVRPPAPPGPGAQVLAPQGVPSEFKAGTPGA